MGERNWWEYPAFAVCWTGVLVCDVVLHLIHYDEWGRLRENARERLRW